MLSRMLRCGDNAKRVRAYLVLVWGRAQFHRVCVHRVWFSSIDTIAVSISIRCVRPAMVNGDDSKLSEILRVDALSHRAMLLRASHS